MDDKMSNTYIGFRVEIVGRIIKIDLDQLMKQYNANNSAQLFDLYANGKITVERKDSMLIARGKKDKQKKDNGGVVNFSLMTPVASSEVDRLVQIINVLGNGRLIRERVKTFIDRNSTLNQIPELDGMIHAFNAMELCVPGFILGGWYYAPEAKLNE